MQSNGMHSATGVASFTQHLFDGLQVSAPSHDDVLVESRIWHVHTSSVHASTATSASMIDNKQESDFCLLRKFGTGNKLRSLLPGMPHGKTCVCMPALLSKRLARSNTI